MIPLTKPFTDDSEANAVRDVLRSGWLAHGPNCQKLEEMFSDYIGVKHSVCVNSCTSALHLAVMSLGITGEVIVPSFTFVATANAVVTAGAKPVFADITEDTCNIDPVDIEKKITPRTQAIIPVHYAGHPADMDEIMRIAKKHKLFVIEDSAECIGGEFGGRRAGSIGDVGCFSFFPTKNMTTGEGGMVTTNNDSVTSKVKTLKAHGISTETHEREKKEKPWFRAATMAGFNFRMSDVCAAIGVEQMKKLEKMNSMRIESAGLLSELLEGSGVESPVTRKGCRHVFQMYTIKLPSGSDRTKFINKLKELGVQASVHFDPPVHLQPYYESWKAKLPVTEDVYERIVTLPMYAGMSKDDVKKVAASVKSAMKEL
jgi:perosamine synthetase